MNQERIPCTILIKRRISGDPGPPPSLAPGELAFNEVGNIFYTKSTNPSLSSNDPGTF